MDICGSINTVDGKPCTQKVNPKTNRCAANHVPANKSSENGVSPTQRSNVLAFVRKTDKVTEFREADGLQQWDGWDVQYDSHLGGTKYTGPYQLESFVLTHPDFPFTVTIDLRTNGDVGDGERNYDVWTLKQGGKTVAHAAYGTAPGSSLVDRTRQANRELDNILNLYDRLNDPNKFSRVMDHVNTVPANYRQSMVNSMMDLAEDPYEMGGEFYDVESPASRLSPHDWYYMFPKPDNESYVPSYYMDSEILVEGRSESENEDWIINYQEKRTRDDHRTYEYEVSGYWGDSNVIPEDDTFTVPSDRASIVEMAALSHRLHHLFTGSQRDSQAQRGWEMIKEEYVPKPPRLTTV